MTTSILGQVELADTTAQPRSSLLRRTLRNPLGLTCAIILFAFILVGIFAPWLSPFDPNATRIELTNVGPFESEYILGGDSAGRDNLSRLIWGTRNTLLACVVLLVVSVAVGVTAGLIAGFKGGAADSVGNWVSDAIMALPGVVLLIALYPVIGSSIIVSMAILGVLVAPNFFRLVRGIVQGVRNELYVDAARVVGLSDTRIIFRHVLTAVRGAIIIAAAFTLGSGISIQASLEFLGLGNPRDASWGGMLQLAFQDVYRNPLNVLWPAAVIVLAILVLVLLGNVIRDVLQASHQRPISVRARRAIEAARVSSFESADQNDVLLEVNGLRVAYPQHDDLKEVVQGVSLSVHAGEIYGLVGESGSGKSQTAFSILGLLPPEAVITAGSIRFDGADMLSSPKKLASVRGRRIAYIPQEPMSNLDPSFTIGDQLSYGLRAVRRLSRASAKKQLIELLARMGIKNPEAVWQMYPHEISGGMAQRVLITGAVASDPDLIIADEPTTALDVTVQADVLQLLRELREERGLGVLLVTHNLGVVADICDTVGVMKSGEIVETAGVVDLFTQPTHAYTRQLLSSTLSSKDNHG